MTALVPVLWTGLRSSLTSLSLSLKQPNEAIAVNTSSSTQPRSAKQILTKLFIFKQNYLMSKKVALQEPTHKKSLFNPHVLKFLSLLTPCSIWRNLKLNKKVVTGIKVSSHSIFYRVSHNIVKIKQSKNGWHKNKNCFMFLFLSWSYFSFRDSSVWVPWWQSYKDF